MTYDSWKTREPESILEDLAAADELICRLKDERDDLLAALETIRDGLRNLPASATAVQLDDIAAAAIAKVRGS